MDGTDKNLIILQQDALFYLLSHGFAKFRMINFVYQKSDIRICGRCECLDPPLYRATPHATTGKSPAELLFNRQITTKLPNLVKDTASIALKEKDSQSKEKMKFYADQKRHVKESDLR